MTQEDLARIRNLLLKVVAYIDKSIDKTTEKCLHEENVLNFSTMGRKNKNLLCSDCGHIWEEEDNVEDLIRSIQTTRR